MVNVPTWGEHANTFKLLSFAVSVGIPTVGRMYSKRHKLFFKKAVDAVAELGRQIKDRASRRAGFEAGPLVMGGGCGITMADCSVVIAEIVLCKTLREKTAVPTQPSDPGWLVPENEGTWKTLDTLGAN